MSTWYTFLLTFIPTLDKLLKEYELKKIKVNFLSLDFFVKNKLIFQISDDATERRITEQTIDFMKKK